MVGSGRRCNVVERATNSEVPELLTQYHRVAVWVRNDHMYSSSFAATTHMARWPALVCLENGISIYQLLRP